MAAYENSFDAAPRDGWDALRYAARRLDPTETAQFEERLADDTAACAAVAQAVELAYTVAFLHWESEAPTTHSAHDGTAKRNIMAAVEATASPHAVVTSATTPAVDSAKTRRRVVAGLGWIAAVAASVVAWVGFGDARLDTTPAPTPPSVVVEAAPASGDAVTSAWAKLNGPRANADDFTVAADESGVEHVGLREVSRDADEALMLDWLMNGLRDEKTNGPSVNN